MTKILAVLVLLMPLAAQGTITACSITKPAVAANTVLTWAVGTACLVTNPSVNMTAHFTTP